MVVTAVFFLIHIIPGDPVTLYLGEGADMKDIQRLRQNLHLDKSLPEQYFLWVGQLIQGSLGKSMVNGKEVGANLMGAFLNTMRLALPAFLMALLISILLGGIWAARQDSVIHSLAYLITSLGMALPVLILGPLLVWIFALWIKILPVSGFGSGDHLILPVLTLGFSISAWLTRFMRSVFAEEYQKEYVLLARSKGVGEIGIFFKHLLKNSLLSLMSVSGLQLAALLGGAILTEHMFSLPGMGTLLIDSIKGRDYPQVQGILLFVACGTMMVHCAVDLGYYYLRPGRSHDPKI